MIADRCRIQQNRTGIVPMAEIQSFLPHGDARKRGAAVSLVIHAGLLILLFSLPAARLIPAARTVYISLGQEERGYPESPAGVQPDDRLKTETARKTKPEPLACIQTRQKIETQAFPKEKPAPDAGQNAAVMISSRTGPSPSEKQATAGITREKSEPRAPTVFGTPGAPSFIHREIPVYPLLARRLGKEGRVVLKLAIDEKGRLQHIEVVEHSGFGFTEAALDAVRKSSFAPARRMGRRIASQALLSVRFVLKQKE